MIWPRSHGLSVWGCFWPGVSTVSSDEWPMWNPGCVSAAHRMLIPFQRQSLARMLPSGAAAAAQSLACSWSCHLNITSTLYWAETTVDRADGQACGDGNSAVGQRHWNPTDNTRKTGSGQKSSNWIISIFKICSINCSSDFFITGSVGVGCKDHLLDDIGDSET